MCVKRIRKKKKAGSWATHCSRWKVNPQEWDSRNGRCLEGGASSYVDYFPAEGLALPGPHSKHRINTPHPPCVDQSREDCPQKHPSVQCQGLNLPCPVIWSQCVCGKVTMFQVSQLRGRKVKVGGQDEGTKLKWRNRVRQGEGEQSKRKQNKIEKGKGKREVNSCNPGQKKGWGKVCLNIYTTILLLVKESTTQDGPFIGLNSSTSYVDQGSRDKDTEILFKHDPRKGKLHNWLN